MKHFKQYIIISFTYLLAFSLVVMPSMIMKNTVTKNEEIKETINESEIETENETKTVAALDTSESIESLDKIPDITVQWKELKELVEAPESSEEVSETEDIIEDTVTEVEEDLDSEISVEDIAGIEEVEGIEGTDATDEIKEGTFIYFDVPLSEELQKHIFEQCEAVGLKPEIVVAVINKESTYDSSVIGDNGNSYGLMQIQPRWHYGRMEELGCNDLLDPFDNVTVGIDILGDLLGSNGNNGEQKPIEWVLMAYNGGEHYADTLMSEGRISDYANAVLSESAELKATEGKDIWR